jgi:hypothetical protein
MKWFKGVIKKIKSYFKSKEKRMEEYLKSLDPIYEF